MNTFKEFKDQVLLYISEEDRVIADEALNHIPVEDWDVLVYLLKAGSGCLGYKIAALKRLRNISKRTPLTTMEAAKLIGEYKFFDSYF